MILCYASGDQVKLIVLFLLLFGCMITLLTSNGIALGDNTIPKIAYSTILASKYCDGDVTKKNSNSNNNNNYNNSISCDKVIMKAIRTINTSGCAKELQTQKLCELEWCHSSSPSSSTSSCHDECLIVRQNVELCIDSIIISYLHYYNYDIE